MELFATEKSTVAMMGSAACANWLAPLLQDDFHVRLADDANKLLSIARGTKSPGLILLEYNQDNRTSWQLCQDLKNDPVTWDIPIIVCSAVPSTRDEIMALEHGAADYLNLPPAPDIFMARIRAQMAHQSKIDLVRQINSRLERVVKQGAYELAGVQDATILAMTSLARTRDIETGNHIRRTQHYVRILSKKLQFHPRFSEFLTERNIELLFKSAPLHDIGKVGIPDRILLKPGRLNDDEMSLMKTHTTLGRDTISYAESLMSGQQDFLTIAKEIAYSHHEKWNGSGYPEGLIGQAIPISARLMAVADVYDAIISRRVYKEGLPHETAVNMIVKDSGIHFDPDIVNAFLGVLNEFQQISARFADPDENLKEKIDCFSMKTFPH